jgi:hypothetical protein
MRKLFIIMCDTDEGIVETLLYSYRVNGHSSSVRVVCGNTGRKDKDMISYDIRVIRIETCKNNIRAY